MKTKEEIESYLAQIKSDPRLSYPPAKISINAPLALIQTGLDAWVAALEWTLGVFEEAEQKTYNG